MPAGLTAQSDLTLLHRAKYHPWYGQEFCTRNSTSLSADTLCWPLLQANGSGRDGVANRRRVSGPFATRLPRVDRSDLV